MHDCTIVKFWINYDAVCMHFFTGAGTVSLKGVAEMKQIMVTASAPV